MTTHETLYRAYMPYHVYDRKLYVDLTRCSSASSGYLRHAESLFNISIPSDIVPIVFHFYYVDKIKELLCPIPHTKSTTFVVAFLDKLFRCCTTLDFAIDTNLNCLDDYELAKQKKTEYLTDISALILEQPIFCSEHFQVIFQMISRNIFRSLPYVQHTEDMLMPINDGIDGLQVPSTQYQDPSWPHLHLVYEILSRVVNCSRFTAYELKYSFWKTFLVQLMELFASEDKKERECLMNIVHKIYEKFPQLRSCVYDIMSNYFYRVMYDKPQKANGVNELLQIVCAIIPGLNSPTRATIERWKSFARNVLVPLHKCSNLKAFWEPLTQCCGRYAIKDENGGDLMLEGILKFWPQQNAMKEAIFVMIAVNIVNVMMHHTSQFMYEEHSKLLVCFVRKLAQCVTSWKRPVVLQAAKAFGEACIQRLIDYDRKAMLPSVCEAFLKTKRYHRYRNVEVVKVVKDIQKIYICKDTVYWNKMKTYLKRKEKQTNSVADAISKAQMRNENAFEVVQKRHRKRASSNKKPKQWTVMEKSVRREHNWTLIKQIAAIHKSETEA